MLNFLFRKPIFPVICDIDGFVFAARSGKALEKQLQVHPLDPEKSYRVVDATAEDWSFIPKHMVISPLTFKKNWTKKDVIALYNGRKNMSEEELLYSEKSLSSKRFDRIFGEIVALLLTMRKKRKYGTTPHFPF